MSDNTIIPNSYQKPNFFVDHLLYFLTSDEAKVLDLAIREIYGWRDSIAARRANIALSVFSEGKVLKSTGERVAWGTGLSVGTCRKCLDALCSFGIMLKLGAPSPDGQCYGLQENPDAIAWDALKARRAETEDMAKKRMAKALESRGVMCDITPNVPHKGGGNVPLHATPYVPLQQGNTVETHIETQINIDAGQKTPAPPKVKAPKVSPPEPVEVYRQVMEKYPRRNTWGDIASTVIPHNGNMGLWREIVTAWKLHGWNPANIAGMLDCWRKGEVPKVGYTQGKASRARQPLTQPEAQALYDAMQREKAANEVNL